MRLFIRAVGGIIVALVHGGPLWPSVTLLVTGIVGVVVAAGVHARRKATDPEGVKD
jgi:hypothetical protein